MAALLFGASLLTHFVSSSDSIDCSIRHRKPWHTLSDDERALFVSGFQTLRDRNVLETFILTHRPAQTGGYNPHKTSENLYWHGYYLYEVETQIRALGPEYECFGMPYWDITIDGEYWVNDPNPTAEGMPLYNSMLGGDGNPLNNYCVEDAPWDLADYTTDYMCADEEEEGNCCLKRATAAGALANDTRLFTRSEVNEPVISSDDYADFDDFGLKITDIHVNVHNFIAHEDNTHFNTDTGRPPADPLFVLFHSFLDYVRVLHTDCYDFDRVGLYELENYFPYSYHVIYTDLDYVMRFGVLCETAEEGLDVIQTPMCEETNITVRDFYDTSPNTKWNVLYELGDYWNLNPELQGLCGDNVNMTWFNNEGLDSWNVAQEMETGNDLNDDELDEESIGFGAVKKTEKRLSSGLKPYAIWMLVMLSIVAFVVGGICLKSRCNCQRRKSTDIMGLFVNEYVAV